MVEINIHIHNIIGIDRYSDLRRIDLDIGRNVELQR